jgi:hypothetical protein
MALVPAWGLRSHAARRWVGFILSFVGEELPGMDEAQAAALHLRVWKVYKPVNVFSTK